MPDSSQPTIVRQPAAPHSGPCDHHDDYACDLLDFLAVADDDPRCCIAHHPEADRHSHQTA